MGSDIARRSYDANQQYRGVVMQQGRVFVEADWNEQREIIGEEIRKDVLDIIGPAGTPDDGYKISLPNNNQLFDFDIAPGTMYVGGERSFLPAPAANSKQVSYFNQPDWLNPSAPSPTPPVKESVYLDLREQEVSAVEDHALKDVALGGPDTAQRVRIIQRVVRKAIDGGDCQSALQQMEKDWLADGLKFDPATNQLNPISQLKVAFPNFGAQTNCEPAIQGGYLDADNQLIRVKVVGPRQIAWGYDDASFLYRVDLGADQQTVTLKSRPVDAFHRPRKDQAVELLASGTLLSNGDYAAEADGVMTTLASDYDPNLQTVKLKTTVTNAAYATGSGNPPDYLRIWEQIVDFNPDVPVALGNTGVQVTLHAGPFHVGEYWLFAVRPSTPTLVYPERYLADFQYPDGPRQWVCPLAVIHWKADGSGTVDDCRNHFSHLIDSVKQQSGGCCTVTIRPQDITGTQSLQDIIDQYMDPNGIAVCLMPGEYELSQPLNLNKTHSYLTLEGCHGKVTLKAMAGSENNFLQGLIVLNNADNVTLRGLRFELPKVSLKTSGGKLGIPDSAFNKQLLGTLPQTLTASIGIRPLHCALLTVRDCHFDFSIISTEDTLGVGIFAGSESWGLTVQDNKFIYSGASLSGIKGRFHFLAGYLLAPAETSGNSRANAANQKIRAGALVSPLLQDATFRNNLFSGLTAAAIILSDCGVVKFEDNTVRDTFSGLLILSLLSLVHAEIARRLLAGQPSNSLASDLNTSPFPFAWQDIHQTGALLARLYPLPDQIDMSNMTVQNQPAAPAGEKASTLLHSVLQNVITTFKSLGGGAAASPDTAAPDSAQTSVSANTAANDLKQLSGAGMQLTAFDTQVLAARKKQGLHYSLHLKGNDIDATVANGQSGVGVLIWDDDTVNTSGLIMSANKVRNNAAGLNNGTTKGAAVVILLGERCSISGNLILNEAPAKEEPISLYFGSKQKKADPGDGLVACIGNVFQGNPILPPRSGGLPAPLNDWLTFNTKI